MNAGLIKVAFAANLLWACFVAIFCTDSGVAIPWFLAFACGGLGLIALWILRLFVYLIWSRKREPPVRRRSWAVEPIFVGIVVAAVLTGFAFRVRFLVSWPFLSHYVRVVQAGGLDGDDQPRPSLVGLFVVRETEALPNGVVRMITTTCGFDDCGLTYSPAGEPPRIGEDVYTSLGFGWWQWWRSW